MPTAQAAAPRITNAGIRPTIPHTLFVNVPVGDIQRSILFLGELGFTFNPQFTDATATCMVVGEDAYLMLLTAERFAGFARRPTGDAGTTGRCSGWSRPWSRDDRGRAKSDQPGVPPAVVSGYEVGRSVAAPSATTKAATPVSRGQTTSEDAGKERCAARPCRLAITARPNAPRATASAARRAEGPTALRRRTRSYRT